MKRLLILILLINIAFLASIYADEMEVYDSGWVSINQNELKEFIHNLGGDISHYEIEIQQRDSEGNIINNIGQGGLEIDGSFTGTDFRNLDEEKISVYRWFHDTNADDVRVIIHKNLDSNIQDNTTNTSTNTDDISTINTNIGDRNYTQDNYVTDGESLTSSIDGLDRQIGRNSQKLDEHEGRISDLEETEINLIGEVQFIREKNHTISAYTKYDVRHNRIPEVGLKLTVGLGKSWTQKELERLETKLNKIEKLLKRICGKRDQIETKMIRTENGYSIIIDEPNTVKLLKKF